MKVILTFMLTKNKKAFLLFFILLLSCGGVGLYLIENNNQVVKIPIAYEYLDRSRVSKELIASFIWTVMYSAFYLYVQLLGGFL